MSEYSPLARADAPPSGLGWNRTHQTSVRGVAAIEPLEVGKEPMLRISMITLLGLTCRGAAVLPNLALAYGPRTTAKRLPQGIEIKDVGRVDFDYRALHFNKAIFERRAAETTVRSRIRSLCSPGRGVVGTTSGLVEPAGLAQDAPQQREGGPGLGGPAPSSLGIPRGPEGATPPLRRIDPDRAAAPPGCCPQGAHPRPESGWAATIRLMSSWNCWSLTSGGVVKRR